MAITISTYTGPFPVTGIWDYRDQLDDSGPEPTHTHQLYAVGRVRHVSAAPTDQGPLAWEPWRAITTYPLTVGKYRVNETGISTTLALELNESVRVTDTGSKLSVADTITIGDEDDSFVLQGVSRVGPYILNLRNISVEFIKIANKTYELIYEKTDYSVREVTADVSLPVENISTGSVVVYFNKGGSAITIYGNFYGGGTEETLRVGHDIGVFKLKDGKFAVVHKYSNQAAGFSNGFSDGFAT